MAESFMHAALVKQDKFDRLTYLLDEVAKGKLRVKARMRNAVLNKNEAGEKVSEKYARLLRTEAKRDMQLMELVDGLLLSVNNNYLQLNEAAFKGLERLLYPVKRDNKPWRNSDGQDV